MLKGIGKTEFCLWCNSRDMERSREFTFREIDDVPEQTVSLCSMQCEREFAATIEHFRKGRPIYRAGFAIGITAVVLCLVLNFLEVSALFVAGVSLLVMSLILFRYPLIRQDMILKFGLRQGMTWARVSAVLLLLIGGYSFWYYFTAL